MIESNREEWRKLTFSLIGGETSVAGGSTVTEALASTIGPELGRSPGDKGSSFFFRLSFFVLSFLFLSYDRVNTRLLTYKLSAPRQVEN